MEQDLFREIDSLKKKLIHIDLCKMIFSGKLGSIIK
jgi:hypothetical protein